jgi:hypothetical protein
MFEEPYNELIELVKTAMRDPDKWTIKYLNIKYHSPNTDSFARFVKGHKQIGYTDHELVDELVLSLRRNMIELLLNEEANS